MTRSSSDNGAVPDASATRLSDLRDIARTFCYVSAATIDATFARSPRFRRRIS